MTFDKIKFAHRKKVIMKLDVDSDGLISYDDLYSVLLRYRDTLYFKFYNNSSIPNINLFSKEMLSKEKNSCNLRKALVLYENEKYKSFRLV